MTTPSTRVPPAPSRATMTYLHSLSNEDLSTLADNAGTIHHDLCVEERELAARLSTGRSRLTVQERLISVTTEILTRRGALAAEEERA